jgi:branched-chain amino acid transport system substrate-binding protein
MISGDGITSTEFTTIGGDAVIGTKMTFPPDPQKFPSAAEAIKQFRAVNFDPQGYTLYTYAAMQIVVDAANATRSNGPKKVADYMHSGQNFKAAIGEISYDRKGDRTSLDYTIFTWKKVGDQITYVQD